MFDKDIPQLEPDRQYYFMNCCKELIYKKQLKLNRPLTYCVTTFGCQMNAHDSEKLKGILEAIGYKEVEDESADFVIYNTCTVRENANQKLYGHLGLLKNYKKTKNPNMVIALCGCMMQEPHVVETIRTKYPFVNNVFGTHNIYKLAELIYNNLTGENRVIEILEKSTQTVEALPQKRKYSFKSGVNIMYGCNNFCSYCIVPYVRGREKSRKPEDILSEIRELAGRGVKEVMLLGQNVNSYGKIYDYSDGKIVPMPEGDSITFPALLKKVCEVDGIERIRFMTSHPKDLSDELIEVMASEPKICKHLHLPVQSGSTDILNKMNRRYTKEGYLSLVDKIRQAMPDISLTTGTPAAQEENQVPEDIVKDRFNRLLTLVNNISNERISRYAGETKDILVEEINHQDSSLLTGRTEENITVHFKGDSSLIGEIIKVKLIECRGFYYIGERI